MATAGLVALALLGLLALVAIGARGSHPLGNGRLSQRTVPQAVNNDLLTTMIVVYLLGVVAVGVIFWQNHTRWKAPAKSRWLRNLLLSMVFFALIGLIGAQIAALRDARRHTHSPAAVQKGTGKAPTFQVPPSLRSSNSAHFDWTFAAGILGLLAVGTVLYASRTRRPLLPADTGERVDDVAEQLSVAVSESIDDLLREPDPRRAVIAAYARMEGVLARSGRARRPAEAPLEYLARILRDLDVSGDGIRELTDLFERAKFSVHEIDQPMKDRAIACFSQVRDDLRRQAVAA